MTTGLTWGLNRLDRSNPSFSRNLADQDGEALEPWISDGTHHELSWALTAWRDITPWLSFKADAWNSLVAFSPRWKEWSNLVYLQHCGESSATALYQFLPTAAEAQRRGRHEFGWYAYAFQFQGDSQS